MAESRFPSKDALSRECIRLGTALGRTKSGDREALASLQQRVDAMLPTDTAAIAEYSEELEALERKLTKQASAEDPPRASAKRS